MKNLLIGFVTILVISACKKDKIAERETNNNNELKLERTVSVSVEGFVFDEAGAPVANAKVVAGDVQVSTTKHGFFSIPKVLVPDVAGAVSVYHDNYFAAISTFAVNAPKTTSLSIRLRPKTIAGNFEAVDGGAVALENGSRLVFTPGSIVKSTGEAYNGKVQVAMTYADPAKTETAGNRTGLNKDNVLRYTESYGVIGVELKGTAGEKLQVAAGSKVQVSIPVSPDWQEKAPAQTSLWSLNEDYGLWQEEGVLAKNGSNYTGEVSHFSFWQAADGIDLVSFKAVIVDDSNTPIGGAGVTINYNGSVNSAAAGYGRADNDGLVTGYIPANKALSLSVGGGWAICADGGVVKTFTTSAQDLDLGNIVGSVARWMITLKGTLVNCDNSPVQQGYVYTYGKGFFNKIPVTNGVFNFSGLICASSSVNIVGVDEAVSQQSEPLQVSLSPGTTEFELQACVTPATTHLTLNLDGTDIFKKEESNQQEQILGIYTLGPGTQGWTNAIVFDNNWRPVSGSVYFIFSGLNASGVHSVNEVFLANDKRLISETPISVNITSYGKVGGFVEGSFEGVMFDWENGVTGTTPRQVSCSFKIRRIM